MPICSVFQNNFLKMHTITIQFYMQNHKICINLQNLSLHGVLLKKPKKKERIHLLSLHTKINIQLLHTYTFKCGGSLVIPLSQPSRHIHVTHYRTDYNVSKAASQMSDQLNSLSESISLQHLYPLKFQFTLWYSMLVPPSLLSPSNRKLC